MNWFKHDINSLADDRLSALVQEHGAEGYAVFYSIVEALYANEGSPLDRLSLKRIAKDFGLSFQKVVEIADYASSDECGGLLHKRGDGYSSERVCKAIEENEAIVRAKKEAAYKRWQKHKGASNADAMQMQSKCITDGEEIREDKNDKSSSSEESLSPKEELSSLRSEISSDKTSSFHSDVSPELCGKLQRSGEGDAPEPVFMTIRSVNNEDVPILEADVDKWAEAYPAVDVRTEVRQAGAWCDANPRNRKSAGGMKRFLVNWLSRSQDRASRSGSGRSSNDYIKGTDIPMTARADGMDPDRFKGKDFNQIFEETYGYRDGRKVPREGKA